MLKHLDSKKLRLVKLRKSHFPLFYKWWNDRELRQLTSDTFQPLSSESIDKILSGHLNNKHGFDFIITYDKTPIGHILIQKKKRPKYFELYIAIGEKNSGIVDLARSP